MIERSWRTEIQVSLIMLGKFLTVALAMLFLTGCASTLGEQAVVKGAGPDELLKMRTGPGLGYKVLLGIPDETVVTRHSCVTEVGQLWCRVSLAKAPGVSGYVSADYLSDR